MRVKDTRPKRKCPVCGKTMKYLIERRVWKCIRCNYENRK